MDIEAGVLDVVVQYGAYARQYSSVGGYRYRVVPREGKLSVKGVERIDETDDEDSNNEEDLE
jgi:hypothetical protein